MTAPPNAWPVPDGFVIVPREPTIEMLDRACEVHIAIKCPMPVNQHTADVWHAMLAAAPAPPVPQAKDVPPAWDYASGRPIT
jgi:hypothetical protein